MNIYFMRGTDEGYWWVDSNGHWHHEEGWGIESKLELTLAVEILQKVAQLKTPELSERIGGVLTKFIQKEVSTYTKEGGIMVINAGRQEFKG